MTKRIMPCMPLVYAPTPGDREKRCKGFEKGRGNGYEDRSC